MADHITTSSPLLECHESGGADRERERRRSSRVQKVIDVQESKDQIIYSLPMIFTNLLIYSIPITSVMFASHLGQLAVLPSCNSHVIREEFSSLRFFLAASITLDSIQGVLSGVASGCNWQRVVTVINLGNILLNRNAYCSLLWFQVEVLWYCLMNLGLWIGIICGIFCQSSSLLLMTIFRKWTKLNAAMV